MKYIAFITSVLCLASSSLAYAATNTASTNAKLVQAVMPELMMLYKDLHQSPELSSVEFNTAKKLAIKARELGFSVTENVGGTGVVAVLKNGKGPTVLIRADMDALPIKEQTGLAFASQVITITEEGLSAHVMHACGHDTHMTSWLGTAKLLSENKENWSGTLVMILQPAEERGRGAKAMLADGLYKRFPKPDYALAFHNSASLKAGVIGYTPGFTFANVDSVNIDVKGIGGHGAYPHLTKDPIVLGARIVGALQTLVSRELNPQDPAVVTVGSFQSGTKHNIISDQALLLLTVRSYSDATRQTLLDGIKRIAKGEGIAMGLPDELLPVVTVKDEFTPATYNEPEFTKKMAALFTAELGKERVIEVPAVMAGEDFGRYYRADTSIKSMIFWVGGVPHDKWQAAQETGEALPSLHSPFWAPDAKKVISTAIRAMNSAVLTILAN
ncbi:MULTISPECIES: amidohydrolase [Colwellia]|uniref:N-acyl-L-amino acid amidohydrolase n=1 Tax=Colwellia marinimaniae TaxID=1513592 RepID=A0ABQ0MTP9_9GAMM|nr:MULTISPECIES: amidohydrolase [Colwellia]GAW95717.1 N-acyl-L-amino acid amidohydrolase [Colwellia marinimaniae]